MLKGNIKLDAREEHLVSKEGKKKKKKANPALLSDWDSLCCCWVELSNAVVAPASAQ